MADIADERRKILDGTYPSRVVQRRQNKHIPGTVEFEQNRAKMQKVESNPSILTADAQELVDRYKGTGYIDIFKGSVYPREEVGISQIIGQTWVKSLRKYVGTKRIKIFYSSKGVHVVPISDYDKE